MKIAVASDHGGLELKQKVFARLKARGLDVLDMGTCDDNSVDYPDYAQKVAVSVARGEVERGVLVCGTGIGMSIAANKINGIRAALVHDEFTARMAREHNDANILVLGGRILDPDLGCRLVEVWLDSSFEAGRHQIRLEKIAQLEN